MEIRFFDRVRGERLQYTYALTDSGVLINLGLRHAKQVIGSVCKQQYRHFGMTWQSGKKKQASLHNLLYENFVGPIPLGYTVDHINRDTTDNSLSNLRLATEIQQCWNRDRKGVYFNKKVQKWCPQVFQDGVSHCLGYFSSLTQALVVRDLFVIKHRGAFANTKLVHIADCLHINGGSSI